MTTATELNAQTDASLAARAAQAVNPPKTAPKRTAKPAPKPAKPAPKAVTPPKVRKALTPRERAAKPVTATIAAYVAWLKKELGPQYSKLTKDELAGISITLYGQYQVSPARRAARGA